VRVFRGEGGAEGSGSLGVRALALRLNYMDAELKGFLEKIAGSLEDKIDRLRSEIRTEIATLRSDLRTAIAETREELDARIDGVALIAQGANRTFRTRDFRILALEERVNEVEKRLLDVEGQEPQ
jgi:hypothetical protein